MAIPLLTLHTVVVAGRTGPRLTADLQVAPGVTAVLGPSAAGKTTLLDVAVGYQRPDRGVVELAPVANRRLPLFWCPSEGGLWGHRTVREHLALVDPGCETADRLLAAFDLEAVAAVRPAQLSLGQQARLGVARGLAADARLLVLDEPLAHVDPARVGVYWQRLVELARERDTALLFATHQPEPVLAHADTVICLDQGAVVFQGPVAELYESPASAELARYLGPANWIPDAERSLWSDRPLPTCVRPERLRLAAEPDGPLVVQDSRHAGTITHTRLCHRAAGVERTIHHVSGPAVLPPGIRVALRLCLVLLLLAGLAGCIAEDDGDGMRATRHRSLPALGARLPAPRGITTLPDDQLLVLDNAGRVLVFGGDLQLRRWWTMPAFDVGRPEGACALRDGRIAVADTHYSRVVFFGPDGTVSSMMGSRGTGPGQFLYPIKVTQDPAGHLYVAEYGSNDRVQKFTEDGKWLLSFGSFGDGPEQFQRPSGLVWTAGKVYVADAVHHRVQVFSDQGRHLATIGGADATWRFRMPYDLAIGPSGDLYACEYGAGRVTRFTTDGRLVARFGKVGRGAGELVTPWGITVLSDDRVLVADTGNRRLVEWQHR